MDQSHEQKLGILVVQNILRGMELKSQLGLQSQQICPFVHIRSRELKVYSHPHSTP
jgi:hypothetical protein